MFDRTQVRTFYSSFYQTPVMPYFVRAGLRVALGVFLYKGTFIFCNLSMPLHPHTLMEGGQISAR